MKLKHVDASRACTWCGTPWFQSMPRGLGLYPPYQDVGATAGDGDHAEHHPEQGSYQDVGATAGDGDHAEHQPEQSSYEDVGAIPGDGEDHAEHEPEQAFAHSGGLLFAMHP